MAESQTYSLCTKKKYSKLLQISRVLVFVTKVTNSVTQEFYKIDVIQGNKAGVSDSQSTYWIFFLKYVLLSLFDKNNVVKVQQQSRVTPCASAVIGIAITSAYYLLFCWLLLLELIVNVHNNSAFFRCLYYKYNKSTIRYSVNLHLIQFRKQYVAHAYVPVG